MKHPMATRWAVALAVFTLTAASYAQWSNPADDVPAYHPSAPLNIHPFRPSCTAPSSPARTSAITGRCTPTSWRPDSRRAFISCPATAAATAPWATPACTVAMKTRTPPSAPPAPQEGFYAYNKTKAGWTPAQIRAGIARHEYESIDLRKAVSEPAALAGLNGLAVDSHPVLEDDRAEPACHCCHLRPRIAIDFESIHLQTAASFGTHCCTTGPIKCASMALASA